MMLPYLLFTAGLISAAASLLTDDLAGLLEWGGTAVILFVTGWLAMLAQYVSGSSRAPQGGRPGTAAAAPVVAGLPGSTHPEGVPMPCPSTRGGAAGPTFESWPYRIGELP